MENITIHLRKLSQKDVDLINEVHEIVGQKTLSKATLEVFAGYLFYKRRCEDLERRHLELINKHRK